MKIVNSNVIEPEGYQKKVTAPVLEMIRNIMRQKKIVSVEVQQVKELPKEDGQVSTWVVDLDGVTGLIPFSESGLAHENQMKQFVGRDINVQFTKIIQERDLVICSRKKALFEMQNRLFENIKVGQRMKGVVHGVGDNSVHVDVGGYVCEVPRKEATHSQALVSLRRFFTVNDHVEGIVKSIKQGVREIELSLIDAMPNPWDTAKIKRGDVVKVIVTNIHETETKQGEKISVAFGEVVPGLQGILTLPAKPIDISVGDRVQAVIQRFVPEQQRLRLRVIQKIKK